MNRLDSGAAPIMHPEEVSPAARPPGAPPRPPGARRPHRAAEIARILGSLLSLTVLAGPGCGDGSASTVPDPQQGAIIAGPALLYDGGFNAPLGPLRITDLRSKRVEVDGDSVDLYAAMQDYETRNLTIFRQAGAADRPVVVVIHGGGWVDGYMEWYAFTAESFTGGAGYVTVVVNYRLTSESVFPAALCPTRSSPPPDPSLKAAWFPDNIDDCADALGWVVDHIAEHGGDPERIFLFGQSAGGHLAALLATHPDYAALRPSIRGVIGMSGAYDLAALNPAAFGDAIDQTFGTHADEALLDEASPATYLAPGLGLPPFLVLYCEDELPSLTSQALAFAAQLGRFGYEVETTYLPGYGHVSEMQALDSPGSLPAREILAFIAARL